MNVLIRYIIIQFIVFPVLYGGDVDLLAQIKSSIPEERSKCIEVLELKLADGHLFDPNDYEVIYKLIQDVDFRVKSDALLLIYSLSDNKKMPFDTAKKFKEIIQNSINQWRSNLLGKSNFDDGEILVSLRSCIAMSALYMWYPMASFVEYSNWQSEVVGDIFKHALNERDRLSDDSYYALLKLFDCVYDATLVVDLSFTLVNSMVNDIDRMSADKVQDSILFLWRHPVMGKNHPMHPILTSIIRPHVDVLISKSKTIANPYQRDEILRILNRIASSDNL